MSIIDNAWSFYVKRGKMNKAYSLKKNHQIENLVKRKKSVGSKYYALYYRTNTELKIAYSISKKYGCAVDRNYAKRVTREIIRNNFSLIPQTLLLVIIKPSSKDLTFEEKTRQLRFLLNKMNEEISKGEKDETRKK